MNCKGFQSKNIACLGLLFSSMLTAYSQTPSQFNAIRSAYRKSLVNNNAMASLETSCKPFTSHPLANAYYGSFFALKCRDSWLPTTKLSLAKKAEEHLNQAVEKNKTLTEIRFLRFSFEYATPSILNMKTHLKEDKPFLLQMAHDSSPIADIVKAFVKDCTLFSATEKMAFSE